MWVDVARLQPDTVPRVCAKTGVPTTLLQRHRLLDVRRGSYWWLLAGLPFFLIDGMLRSRSIRIVLPIARDVQVRYVVLRAARAAGAIVLVLSLLTADGLVSLDFLLALVATVAVTRLHMHMKDAWVRPRWEGGPQVRIDPHPAFHAALEATRRPLTPDPMPVWPEAHDAHH